VTTSIGLAILTSLNIVTIFIYQWYILIVIGPGVQTDSLFAGMVIPQLVLNVTSGSLIYVLIPILSVEKTEKFREDVWSFIHAIGIVTVSIFILLYFTAEWWVPLTVPGFSVDGRRLTIVLTRIHLIGMVFVSIGAVLTAACQARYRFLYAAGSGLGASIVSIIFLWALLCRYGIEVAAWGFTIRNAIQMIIQLPIIGSYKRPNWHNENLRKAWGQLRPLLFGNIYYKTDQIVDRFLASMAPAGGISILHLSQQIYGAANQVAVASLAAPVAPALAQSAARGDWLNFIPVIKHKLVQMAGLSLVFFFAILVAGKYPLQLLFGYGHFRPDDLYQLWLILIAMGGVLLGGLLGQILSTGFYALGDTITPTKIGVVGFTFGVVFKITGFFLYGIVGIVVGTSLYYLIMKARMHQYERAFQQKNT
jgi:putative peptidoglycan lipid II flippase